MGRVRSFRELVVYRDAFRLAMALFEETRGFPEEEKYDLTRQLRRSSRSVCANLAEAWRRRRYPAAFVAKLIDAEAEATESRVHLDFARACGYMSEAARARYDDRLDHIISRLVRMRANPRRWHPGSPAHRSDVRVDAGRQTREPDSSRSRRSGARLEGRSGWLEGGHDTPRSSVDGPNPGPEP